jgi:endonuclease YncB( thermonuclease family)
MRKKLILNTMIFFVVPVFAVSNLGAATFAAWGYKILDGDSIIVVFKNKQISIELDGIDCPEPEQEFGKEAAEFTTSFVYKKKLTVDIRNYDEEDRMIARVAFDGKDLSLTLVEEGLAWYVKKKSSGKKLVRAQKKAKKAKKGLWKQSKPTPPWTFRDVRQKLKEIKEQSSEKNKSTA